MPLGKDARSKPRCHRACNARWCSILSDFGGCRFEATENRIIFCDLVVWRNNVGGAGSGRLGPGLDAAGIGWKRISSFRPFGETRGDRIFP